MLCSDASLKISLACFNVNYVVIGGLCKNQLVAWSISSSSHPRQKNLHFHVGILVVFPVTAFVIVRLVVTLKFQSEQNTSACFSSLCRLSLHCTLICTYNTHMHTENLQVGLGMQRGSSSPPESTHTHTYYRGKKKTTPCSPAPCPSRQLQTQLLFSLQTTCYLGRQLCLFVKNSAIYGPSWWESLCPHADYRIKVHGCTIWHGGIGFPIEKAFIWGPFFLPQNLEFYIL